ncbi:hypothetical protein DRN43_03870 [Thermococci archaeon]|uniref:tetratricopeptide repeat protein n=1 Tax=Palaeococcus sp. (in: euryarchaeotes) TaxID=2820298 RepID=UPI000F2256CA|nr:hypothetical protein [Palaeococcus sp. (in: euryarchaeotes)]MCD6559584.1 hypothetical protein [Palaeococcus sp. (in: euryarchaeotes)]RLF78704.1 MAG: hypothetical protein DRN39_00315 [Thermococci archaeon]RLF89387.1 MAG: hypothetical protein DRN43_03870 [Thermococci archaeon]
MLIKEVMKSVEVIKDPAVRAITYAKIGVELTRMKNPLASDAFKRALDTVYLIENPVFLLKNLSTVAYYMGKAGLKSSKRIFQQIEDDLRGLPKGDRDLVRVDIVKYLVDLDEIDEAIYHASEISDSEIKNEALLLALKRYLFKIKRTSTIRPLQIRKAEYIWQQIQKEPYYSVATFELIRTLLRVEEYDRAIYMINYLRDPLWVKQVMREVITHLKKVNVSRRYYERLVSVAIELSKRLRLDITGDLIVIFALNGEVNGALKLIRSVRDYNEMLVELSKILVKRKPDVLLTFLQKLSEDELNLASREIMNYLLEHPEKELEYLVSFIALNVTDERVLVKVVNYYLKTGDVESAVKISAKIGNEELRSLALGSIAHHLLRENRIDDAIDLVMHVKDPKLSSQLISELLVKVVRQSGGGKSGDSLQAAEKK